MTDRDEIANVLARVAITQDDHDWDGHMACFVPDVRYVHPKGELSGATAVAERARKALEPLDASQHLLGTIVIEVDGDTAESSTYFIAQHVRAAAPGGATFWIAGTYRDSWVRRDGRWLIAERLQTYSWRDGNPDVIVR